MEQGFIPKHGGYKNLLSYKKAVIIYDSTVCFCARFFHPNDRIISQMTHAARSGKQNLVEGSMASATSKEMEIKLTGVARASMEELLEDYEDFLRTSNVVPWNKDSREAQYVRKLGRSKDESYDTYRPFVETRPAHIVANILICLIHQCNCLIDRQIDHLQNAFLKEGGLRERMTRARLNTRGSRNVR